MRQAIVFVLALLACAPFARAQTPSTMNEQVVMVKVGSGFSSAELETTIFRPDGAGPFPVAVINHGKASGNPRFQERARFLVASREFVRRGYAVVLPMRMGFSKSSGDYGSGGGCNIAANGEAQAGWVEGVLEWLRAQPFADKDRILLVGQSHGGLTAMALGARNPPGVRGVVNFAGGLKSSNSACIWENSLAQAFARYGARTKLPTLWFYGENDSYFPPEVAKDLLEKYQAAGGNARLVAFGKFGRDAHGMFAARKGIGIWVPEVEKFLDAIGLPSRPVVTVGDAPRPPKSDFARLEDVATLPHVREGGRGGYAKFLQAGLPRAFAIGPAGAWGWAAGDDEAAARALANCQKHSKPACRLYAVDDDVVWQP